MSGLQHAEHSYAAAGSQVYYFPTKLLINAVTGQVPWLPGGSVLGSWTLHLELAEWGQMAAHTETIHRAGIRDRFPLTDIWKLSPMGSYQRKPFDAPQEVTQDGL
jgi:hypothetical protein